MVGLTSLWLPILLSAVFVFAGSSILHMVLPIHRRDFKKAPGEDKLLEVLRASKVAPGDYVFPCAEDPKQMKSPEMMDKYNAGPVGFMSVMPSGLPNMGKLLVQWFLYSLVIGLFVAYLTGRTVGPGAEYLMVFRVAGASAFLAYAMAHISDSIWRGQTWALTFKRLFDGLIYALLTAGTFAWLWPEV
jgi:hypothetical protein